MNTILVNRIKTALDKTFDGKIDLTDIASRPVDEIRKSFYSRALAAYSLFSIADISIEEAANSITDGFDDNGIDAVFFDKNSKNLYLVQSKFIDKGIGGLDNGDVEKFTKGVFLLINCEFERFNQKVQDKKQDILDSLEDPSVKIQIIFAYTGDKLSSHNEASINDLLRAQNNIEEILFFTDYSISEVYKSIQQGVNSNPINEDIVILNWGQIKEPLDSFYGTVSGIELSDLWSKYGKKLFTKNIRNFIGLSTTNEEIVNTIKKEPENFIYFNNGITILCKSIKKQLKGGNDSQVGIFRCEGISVVNGAQTLGSIGSLFETNKEQLKNIKVFVKFISLENSSEEFGEKITIATNTQNKIEKKDFVSIDKLQEKLRIELQFNDIVYHYKRSNDKIISDDKNYTLEEVAFSLASLWENVDYSTIVKKESGRLWEDISAAPYTDIFNPDLTAIKIIKAVRIYRFVTSKMDELSNEESGRRKSILRYGNSFITHIVAQKIPRQFLADSNTHFNDFFTNQLPDLVAECIDLLFQKIDDEFEEATLIPYVLRNYTKCRRLKELIMTA